MNRWRNAYRAISKINDVILNFDVIKTKNQFYRMGLLAWIGDVGGEVEMLNKIVESQKKGILAPKQAHDLREAVKDACSIR